MLYFIEINVNNHYKMFIFALDFSVELPVKCNLFTVF